jgi:type II secretory ATPase GspE/PulE/Tfp pilus assembly ATPase PilB-like protein
VDEKGRPIEIEICKKCGGVGYLGRTGVFEMLVVNDAFREAFRSQPAPDNLRRVARANGHRSLQEEGIVLVAQGTTSLQELQRALKTG